MVLCMDLHMVLGHDGFRPLVFCRSNQGNYDYVLIQGYGMGFMNASTSIYMYCNNERNIMKNKFNSPDFWIKGKIIVYIFFVFYVLTIVYFQFSRTRLQIIIV